LRRRLRRHAAGATGGQGQIRQQRHAGARHLEIAAGLGPRGLGLLQQEARVRQLELGGDARRYRTSAIS
jgi:hypothetical protein